MGRCKPVKRPNQTTPRGFQPHSNGHHRPFRRVLLSEALRHMMAEQSAKLEAERGKPAQGQCADCKNGVPAHELAVKCDQCDSFVCIRCVDAHPHLQRNA
jgi:hypothetical protein